MSSADSPLGWSLVKKDVLHPTADDSCRSRGSVCNAVQCWLMKQCRPRRTHSWRWDTVQLTWQGWDTLFCPCRSRQSKRRPAKAHLWRCRLLHLANTKWPAAACFVKLTPHRNPRTLTPTNSVSEAHSDTQLLSQTMHGRTEVALMSSLSQLVPSSSAALPWAHKGAASTLLWRDWDLCPAVGLQKNHHARRHTRVKHSHPISRPLHSSSHALPVPNADAVRTCHVPTLVLQLEDPTRSWTGQPRDNSSWWAAAALSCTLRLGSSSCQLSSHCQTPAPSEDTKVYAAEEPGERNRCGDGGRLKKYKVFAGEGVASSLMLAGQRHLVDTVMPPNSSFVTSMWASDHLCARITMLPLDFRSVCMWVLKQKLPYSNNLQWKEARVKKSSEGRMFSSVFRGTIHTGGITTLISMSSCSKNKNLLAKTELREGFSLPHFSEY